MAWKAPGEGGKDKGGDSRPNNSGGPVQGRPEHDPWREGRSRPSSQQPPDLDEVAKRIWRTLTGKRRAGGPQEPNARPPRRGNALLLPGIIVGIAGLVWLGAGIYTIDDNEVGVVMRQGRYHGTVEPGIHWNPSLIDRVTRVNTGQDHWLVARRQQLTQDGNLVALHVRASYRIVSAPDYLKSVDHPDQLLQNVVETAVNHVVSSRSLDDVLNADRVALNSAISSVLQSTFPSRLVGAELRDVRVEEVVVPKIAEAARAGVSQAQQQAKETVQQAEAQRDQLTTQADREAHQLQEDAQAYHDTAVAKARSDIAQYIGVLRSYERAPEVMRDRLYLDAMKKVMTSPDIQVVNTQNSSAAVSVSSAQQPHMPHPPVPPVPHGGEVSSATNATPATKSGTMRGSIRADRDSSGERHYDRSLREGRL